VGEKICETNAKRSNYRGTDVIRREVASPSNTPSESDDVQVLQTLPGNAGRRKNSLLSSEEDSNDEEGKEEASNSGSFDDEEEKDDDAVGERTSTGSAFFDSVIATRGDALTNPMQNHMDPSEAEQNEREICKSLMTNRDIGDADGDSLRVGHGGRGTACLPNSGDPEFHDALDKAVRQTSLQKCSSLQQSFVVSFTSWHLHGVCLQCFPTAVQGRSFLRLGRAMGKVCG